MRRFLFILLIICTPCMGFAQNVVRVLSRSVFRPNRVPTISRQVRVQISQFWDAKSAVLSQPVSSFQFHNIDNQVLLTTERTLFAQSIKAPERVNGPYVYTRAVATATERIQGVVSKRYADRWKAIHDVQGYNGAHHLVNKYTLKLIHADLKANGKKISLSDLQNNAPAIFHPLHGDPRFKDIFHDAEQQYRDYKLYGMEVVVISKLQEIDALNRSLGIPSLPEDYIYSILTEAKFWCRHYGLNWDQAVDLEVTELPSELNK